MILFKTSRSIKTSYWLYRGTLCALTLYIFCQYHHIRPNIYNVISWVSILHIIAIRQYDFRIAQGNYYSVAWIKYVKIFHLMTWWRHNWAWPYQCFHDANKHWSRLCLKNHCQCYWESKHSGRPLETFIEQWRLCVFWMRAYFYHLVMKRIYQYKGFCIFIINIIQDLYLYNES